MRNIFKVNNKGTRMTSLTTLFIVNFEHISHLFLSVSIMFAGKLSLITKFSFLSNNLWTLFLLKQYYHNLSSYRRTNLDLCLDKIFLWKNFRRLSRHCLEEGKYDNSFTVIRNVNISPISCSTCYQGNIA